VNRGISRLRFSQLRLLTEMEKGSIRRAAAHLNMTQPAVSKALKDLEAVLGARLYERSARGVTPTPAGRAAARGAKLLLAELATLTEEIRQAESTAGVPARIGMTEYLGASVLPRILSRLDRGGHAPQVRVEEGWAEPLLARLAEGTLDLLLIMCTPDMVPALNNPSLRHERLSTEELAIVAAPAHPLAARRALRLAELQNERWILGAPPSLTRRTLEDAFLHAAIRPPRPILEATILANMVEAAAAGLGIAACPLGGVERALAASRIARLHIRPGMPLPPIVMVYRRTLLQHPRFAALAEAVRREFALLSSRPAARAAVRDEADF
jgi:DNA-binding transcriptional LysR family regulator